MNMQESAPLFIDPANMFKGENLSANEIQNVIKKTMDLSKGSPQQMAGQFPKVMGAGMLGGMSFRETAAMFSASTMITGTTEQAATAMENMVLRAMFTDMPQEEQEKANALASRRGARPVEKKEEEPLAKMLRDSGIQPGDNFIARMRKLNELRKSGGTTDQALAQMFNIRGLRGALPLLRDEMRTFDQFNAEMAATTGADKDLVGASLSARMATDPEFAGQIFGQRATEELELQKQQGASKAMGDENVLKTIEVSARAQLGRNLTPQERFGVGVKKFDYQARRFLYDSTGGWTGTAPQAPDFDPSSGMRSHADELRDQARSADPSGAASLNAAADRLSDAADRLGGGTTQVQNMGRQPPVMLQN